MPVEVARYGDDAVIIRDTDFLSIQLAVGGADFSDFLSRVKDGLFDDYIFEDD